MDMISLKGLTKKYKDITAVDDLTLDVREGELFSLLGVNGAGKTTTIKMMSCLVRPDGGNAVIGGMDTVSDAVGVKKIIGISPQETAVAPRLTVRENLTLIARIHGMNKSDAAAKAEELADTLELSKIKDKPAGKLSGGWQRRLSIAMALVSQPKVLFLDEPTLGLDVIARASLWDLIRQYKGKMTIILTTHYMEESEELSDRIGIMKDGKLLYTGTCAALKAEKNTDSFENAFISVVKGA